MPTYFASCALSGLPFRHGDEVRVLLIGSHAGDWRPFLWPILASFDSVIGFDNITVSEEFAARIEGSFHQTPERLFTNILLVQLQGQQFGPYGVALINRAVYDEMIIDQNGQDPINEAVAFDVLEERLERMNRVWAPTRFRCYGSLELDEHVRFARLVALVATKEMIAEAG